MHGFTKFDPSPPKNIYQKPTSSGPSDIIAKNPNKQIKLTLLWIPSHIGIKGNEEADILAKNSILDEYDPTYEFVHYDYKKLIVHQLKQTWLEQWNSSNNQNNKLRQIKDNTSEWCNIYDLTKREAIVITHNQTTNWTH